MVKPLGYFCVDGENVTHTEVTAFIDNSDQHYRQHSYFVQGKGWCVFIFSEETTDRQIKDFINNGVDAFLKHNSPWKIGTEVREPVDADATL